MKTKFGHWVTSFDLNEEHDVMVARRVKMSNQGIKVAQVEFEESLTCSMRDVCSSFSGSHNSPIKVRNTHPARGARAPTWWRSTLVKDFVCQKFLKELYDNRPTKDFPSYLRSVSSDPSNGCPKSVKEVTISD